jgi:hypothetical protein
MTAEGTVGAPTCYFCAASDPSVFDMQIECAVNRLLHFNADWMSSKNRELSAALSMCRFDA